MIDVACCRFLLVFLHATTNPTTKRNGYRAEITANSAPTKINSEANNSIMAFSFFDVYDAAAWSAVTGLSELSVAKRSRPVDFPDFTKGKWKTRESLKIMGV